MFDFLFIVISFLSLISSSWKASFHISVEVEKRNGAGFVLFSVSSHFNEFYFAEFFPDIDFIEVVDAVKPLGEN